MAGTQHAPSTARRRRTTRSTRAAELLGHRRPPGARAAPRRAPAAARRRGRRGDRPRPGGGIDAGRRHRHRGHHADRRDRPDRRAGRRLRRARRVAARRRRLRPARRGAALDGSGLRRARPRGLGLARRPQVAVPAEGLRRGARARPRGPATTVLPRRGLHAARARAGARRGRDARVLPAVPGAQAVAGVPGARRRGVPARRSSGTCARRGCSTTRSATHADLEPLGDAPQLSIVPFRHVPAGAADLERAQRRRSRCALQNDGRVWVAPADDRRPGLPAPVLRQLPHHRRRRAGAGRQSRARSASGSPRAVRPTA